jgi:hypothetical protein
VGNWLLIDRLDNQYDLENNDVRVMEASGVGMPPMAHKTQATAFTPGALFRGYKVMPRLVTLHQAVQESTYAAFLGTRLELAEIFKPDQLVDDTVPWTLRFQGGTIDLDLDVQYDAGFEMAGRIPATELMAVRLIAYDPFFKELTGESEALIIGGSRTVYNDGTASTFPVITVTGSGTLTQIKNVTTGHELNFDSLVLASGEVLTIDLSPYVKTFTSDVEGNVSGDVLPGSDVGNFILLPGENSISVNSGGGASASIAWTHQHWTIDAAELVLAPRTVFLIASVQGVATVSSPYLSGGLETPMFGQSNGVASVSGTLTTT